MTTQYSVALAQDEADAGFQHIVLATLPNRFRIVSDGDADILVISATGDLKRQLAAIGPGTRALFVSAPGRLSAEAFKAIRERAGGRTIGLGLVAAFTDAAADWLRADSADSPGIVDVEAEVSSSDAGALRAALFEQLMLLDALAGRTTGLRMLTRTSGQAVAAVTLDSTWRGIRISARRNFRDRVALHTVSRSLRRQLTLTAHPHAEPAGMRICDAAGSRSPFPVYEGGQRRSWLDLHDALEGKRGFQDRLAAAARALELLRFE